MFLGQQSIRTEGKFLEFIRQCKKLAHGWELVVCMERHVIAIMIRLCSCKLGKNNVAENDEAILIMYRPTIFWSRDVIDDVTRYLEWTAVGGSLIIGLRGAK
jgi:hypothetical protein